MFEIKFRIGKCPKCNAKCNYKEFTSKLIYIWCTECAYQTFEAKVLYQTKIIN